MGSGHRMDESTSSVQRTGAPCQGAGRGPRADEGFGHPEVASMRDRPTRRPRESALRPGSPAEVLFFSNSNGIFPLTPREPTLLVWAATKVG